MELLVSTSIDAGDHELYLQHTKKVDKKPEETDLDKERKLKKVMQNIKYRIADELHHLAATRKHMVENAVKKAEAFINGLKKRYNELFHGLYGENYYKATASGNLIPRFVSVSSKPNFKTMPKHLKEFLGYMIHDKDHVMSQGSKTPELEEVLKKYSETCPHTLYRGCSEDEFRRYQSGKPIGYYTSFSEDINTAKQFGPKLITLNGAKGLCYWRYLVSDLELLKKENPAEYDSSDGDYLIESAKEEKEWILPFGLTKSLESTSAAKKISAAVLIKARHGSYHGGMQQVSNVNGADVLWNFVKVVDGKYVPVQTQAEATGIVCGKKFYPIGD